MTGAWMGHDRGMLVMTVIWMGHDRGMYRT